MTKNLNHYRRRFMTLCFFIVCLCALLAPAHAKTADRKDLFQFTSGNHVLGFQKDSMYLASGSHMLKVEFVGGKPATPVSKEGPSPDGKAPPLSKVTYSDIWDGVDIVYEKAKGSIVKSTYMIAAGKEPGSVRLRYNRPLSVDKSGNLVIRYETGRMTESKPIAWQVVEGKKKPVMVAYNLHSEREVGFTASDYDKNLPLVIDPSLTWHTFLGGSGDDNGQGIVLDSSGNIYVTGYSTAAWSETPVRDYYGSGTDAFAARLNPDGTLAWYTFLGGSKTDYGYVIALDSSGHVYVAGTSYGTWGDNPVRAYTGSTDMYDVFVAKLNSDGSLVWNTFLGGSSYDSPNGITVDSADNIYVAGRSMAKWSETPVRAYTASYDAFVARLNTGGSLIWHTFLGGSSVDYAYGLVTDLDGYIYVVGYVSAAWSETPVRAYTKGGEGYAAKLNTDGSLIWHTFLGGSGTDYAYNIALDSADNIYVTGRSNAKWSETPVRAYTKGYDAFVARLNTGGSLAWYTFLGGSGDDYGYGIATDLSGHIYVAGHSAAGWGDPDRPYISGIDAFAAKLNSNGSMVWNSFLGGSGNDYGQGMALDSTGSIYVVGYSGAAWPDTQVRAYYGSGNDAFVAMLNPVSSQSILVSRTGTGSGAVTTDPSGIDCGSTCLATFLEGTSVTLTAKAATGSNFTGWSGGCSGTGPCTVTMSRNITVSAEFTLEIHTVNATVASGPGTVSPATQAVSYGSSASVTVTPNEHCHITAITDNGQPVTGASKGMTAGRKGSAAKKTAKAKSIASAGLTGAFVPGPYTYTIDSVTIDHTVAATFDVDTEALKVTKTGTGKGTLTGTALTCGGSYCSSVYLYGATVTITAAADTGSKFAGFTGCDSVSGNTCTLLMTTHRDITARFTGDDDCVYTVSPTGKSFTYKGGSVSISVRAKGGEMCASPDVSASDAWIGTNVSAFRNNKGTLKITTPANNTSSERTGTVTIQGNPFAVAQAGAPCSLTIAPTGDAFTAEGGSGSFTVTTPTGCPWSVSPSVDWLITTTSSGSGPGSVSYTAMENTGKQRTGKITVYLTDTPTKKKVFTVTEKKK